MTNANTTIPREVIEQAAKRAGIKASIGRTEKGGTYHPDKNALGRSVPIESTTPTKCKHLEGACRVAIPRMLG
jgi:hypothetical protein